MHDDDLYAVQFYPSGRLLMISTIPGIQVICQLHQLALNRLKKEAEEDAGCILHEVKLFGKLKVTYLGKVWQTCPEPLLASIPKQ